MAGNTKTANVATLPTAGGFHCDTEERCLCRRDLAALQQTPAVWAPPANQRPAGAFTGESGFSPQL
jgi:hypothetical protein